jgi:STE24 endopeptidase
LGRRAGVDIGAGVAVAGKDDGTTCNAYVVGLGPTRRVVLERALAAWPPELVDQVVAHEIGHWRLRHAARRLPLTLVAQLLTFAFAAWLLSLPQLLDLAAVPNAGDPASYPLLLLLTPALALPARCLLAWRDGARGGAPDEFALSLLGDPGAFAAMLDRAADEGGAPRALPHWRRLTSSHPPIDERALACTRFASTS